MDATEITAVTTAGEQQLKLMEALATNLKETSDRKKEMQSLREELRELREIITTPLIKRLFRKNKNV